VLEVGPIEPDDVGEAGAAKRSEADVLAGQGEFDAEGALADETSVFQPMPLHDDSGEYPLYSNQSSYTPDPYTSGGYENYGAQGYESWQGEPQPAAAGYDGGYQGGYDQQPGWTGQGYGYDAGQDRGGYQQQPAAASYDSGGYGEIGYPGYDGQATGTGDWTPQPHPQHTEPPYPGRPADPYGGGYGYDPQAQPHIPRQQQPPYEPQAQPQYTAEPAEYADPYDPYRY
jgi:hypothetical protein